MGTHIGVSVLMVDGARPDACGTAHDAVHRRHMSAISWACRHSSPVVSLSSADDGDGPDSSVTAARDGRQWVYNVGGHRPPVGGGGPDHSKDL